MTENSKTGLEKPRHETPGPTNPPEAPQSVVRPANLARNIFADKYPQLLMVDEFTTKGNTYIAYHSRADTQIHITGHMLNWELGWQLVTIGDNSHLERTFVFSADEQSALPASLKDRTRIEIKPELERFDTNN